MYQNLCIKKEPAKKDMFYNNAQGYVCIYV